MARFEINLGDIFCSIAVIVSVWNEKYMLAICILLCLSLSELARIRRILEEKNESA